MRLVDAPSWPEVEERDGARRVRVDLEAILADDAREDPDSPLQETWSALRHAIAANPNPRRRDRVFQSGLLRNEIELHALGLRDRLGITELIDDRYVSALSDLVSKTPVPLTPIRLACRWGGQADPRISPRWHRRLFSRLTASSSSRRSTGAGFPPVLDRMFGGGPSTRRSMSDESIRIGPGWIETASGRRRIREEFVTVVLGHLDQDRRIEVRLISIDRAIRLRFESIGDKRFRRFWTRWTAV